MVKTGETGSSKLKFDELPAYTSGKLKEKMPGKFRADMLRHIHDHGPRMVWDSPDKNAWSDRLKKVRHGCVRLVFSKATYLDVRRAGDLWVTKFVTRSEKSYNMHLDDELLCKSVNLSENTYRNLLHTVWGVKPQVGYLFPAEPSFWVDNSQKAVLNPDSWSLFGVSGARAFIRDTVLKEREKIIANKTESVARAEVELKALQNCTRQGLAKQRLKHSGTDDGMVRPGDFRDALHMFKRVLDFAERIKQTSRFWPQILARMPLPDSAFKPESKHLAPMPYAPGKEKDIESHWKLHPGTCMEGILNRVFYELGGSAPVFKDLVAAWKPYKDSVYANYSVFYPAKDNRHETRALVEWKTQGNQGIFQLDGVRGLSCQLTAVVGENEPPVRIPNYKLRREADGTLRLNSSSAIPFTEEEFKAWWRGESGLNTTYGEPKRIKASRPDGSPVWLVEVGCHVVDVAGDLGGEYLELMKPDFEVIKGVELPALEETVEDVNNGNLNMELRDRLTELWDKARAAYHDARSRWLEYACSVKKEVLDFEANRPAKLAEAADELAQAVQAKNTAVTETQEWWQTVGGPDLRQLEELLVGIMHASIPIMHAKVEANGEEHVSKLGT
jgi:hypothetical protein